MRRSALVLSLMVLLTGHGAAQQEQPVLFVDASPAEVYRIVFRAKWAVDIRTVWACTSRRAQATEGSVHDSLMQERGKLPQAVKVLSEQVNGNVAELIVEGVRRDAAGDGHVVSRGAVTLVKEDGTWRIRHETWHDLPPRAESPKGQEADISPGLGNLGLDFSPFIVSSSRP